MRGGAGRLKANNSEDRDHRFRLILTFAVALTLALALKLTLTLTLGTAHSASQSGLLPHGQAAPSAGSGTVAANQFGSVVVCGFHVFRGVFATDLRLAGNEAG